ncbi:hypothetical protein [Microbacterium sulfonylureivorans]|uniref:hypothetical protein n=1 Tax=Microbacterium sulfonylureivorans TaxID=2486854 RepID=UPI0013DF22EA|nr:hypothetical protein [Microbacterium sulfonylureivorans]
MDPLTSLFATVVIGAIAFYVLYLVVRAAVLNALRTHRAEVNAPAPEPVTHLDADGL